jgi:hypothetical protein
MLTANSKSAPDHCPLTTGIYNSRNPEMFLPSSRVRWACCVLLCLSAVANAADWRQPESELAQKIASITGPGVIALDITNRSSISAPEVEQIRRSVVSSLAEAGVRVWQPDQAAATVQLTLSENLQSYVWVAEIRQGITEPSVAIVSTPRPESAAGAQSAFPLTIHATQLLTRADAILYVGVLEGSTRGLLVLGTDSVTPYEFKDGRWSASQPLAISHSRPFPRDLRGRILPRKDHLFDAYLPGVFCRSTSAAPLTLNCSASDDPWPLDSESGVSAFFSSSRNFFTGALVPGIGKQKSAPAFFSAAAIPRVQYKLWLFAGVDGDLHMLDGINHQVATKIHWGSDIAGVRAGCRPGTQVLATSAESGSEDSIQAFEFPDREPLAVSQKLTLNGPVTALWPAQDGQSATAVFRNSETGNYEAILLTLTCGQ